MEPVAEASGSSVSSPALAGARRLGRRHPQQLAVPQVAVVEALQRLHAGALQRRVASGALAREAALGSACRQRPAAQLHEPCRCVPVLHDRQRVAAVHGRRRRRPGLTHLLMSATRTDSVKGPEPSPEHGPPVAVGNGCECGQLGPRCDGQNREGSRQSTLSIRRMGATVDAGSVGEFDRLSVGWPQAGDCGPALSHCGAQRYVTFVTTVARLLLADRRSYPNN